MRLRFSLTQHSRDEKLLKSLVEYLGSGIYYACYEHNLSEFVVTKFADLTRQNDSILRQVSYSRS